MPKLHKKDKFSTKIGENIRKVRASKGMTVKQLGESIGVSPQQMSLYELGYGSIGLKRTLQIAKVLGADLQTLTKGIKL